jgi:hypothetical protein
MRRDPGPIRFLLGLQLLRFGTTGIHDPTPREPSCFTPVAAWPTRVHPGKASWRLMSRFEEPEGSSEQTGAAL